MLNDEELNDHHYEFGSLFMENPTQKKNEKRGAKMPNSALKNGSWTVKKEEVEWSSHLNVHPPSVVPVPLEQLGWFLAGLVYQRVTNNFCKVSSTMNGSFAAVLVQIEIGFVELRGVSTKSLTAGWDEPYS